LLLFLNLSFVLQIILGIWMTYENIPWHAALAHQGNSIIMFSITIYFLSQSLIKIK
jgi:heme A synthase